MATKPKQELPNMLVLELSLDYQEKLVLPYEDGIQLMQSMKNAKIFKQAYGQPTLAYDIKPKTVLTSIIGTQEYAEATLRNTLLAENADPE